MLLVAASPGAWVSYDHTVLRRRAGFSGLRYLSDIQALSRINKSEGPQVAFTLPRFCYNVTRDASQQCSTDLVRRCLGRSWALSMRYCAAGCGHLGTCCKKQ